MGTHPIFESDFDCLTEWSNADWAEDGDSQGPSPYSLPPTIILSTRGAAWAFSVDTSAPAEIWRLLYPTGRIHHCLLPLLVQVYMVWSSGLSVCEARPPIGQLLFYPQLSCGHAGHCGRWVGTHPTVQGKRWRRSQLQRCWTNAGLIFWLRFFHGSLFCGFLQHVAASYPT